MQREKYIDLAKGIGIIMVIFCHIISVYDLTSLEFIFDFCYSFHMPLFFFITGYCLGLKKDTGEKPLFLKNLKKVGLTLFLPYLVWSFVYLVISGDLYDTERLCAVFTLRGIAPIWFLSALGLCEIFFFSMKRWTYKLQEKYSSLIFIAVGIFSLLCGFIMHTIESTNNLNVYTMYIPLRYLYITLGRFFICMPMVIAGYIFSKANILRKLGKVPCFITGSLLMVGVYFTVMFSNLETNIHLFETNNFWVLICTGIMGSVGIMMLSYSLPVFTGVVSLIGTNSIFFMLLHYKPFKIMELSAEAFSFIQNPCLFWICTSLLVLIFTAVNTILVKKLFFLGKPKTKS